MHFFFKTLAFVSFELAIDISLSFVTGVLIPNQVIEFVGERQKSLALGLLVGASAILSFFAGPLAGYWSDKYLIRMPFIIVGTVLWCASIVLRAFFTNWNETSILLYCVISIIGKIVYTVGQTPFIGMIPHAFAVQEYGKVSGFIGVSSMVGAIVGIAGLGYVYHTVPLFVTCAGVAIAVTLSMIPLLCLNAFGKQQQQSVQQQRHIITSMDESVMLAPDEDDDDEEEDDDENSKNSKLQVEADDQQESKSDAPETDTALEKNNQLLIENLEPQKPMLPQQQQSFLYSFCMPFTSSNFTLIFVGTFVANTALWALQSFMLYYIRDMIHPNYSLLSNYVSDPEQAQGVFALSMFFTGVLSSIVSGNLADKYQSKRHIIVVFGCIVCAATLILLLFVSDFVLFVASAQIWGIGIGCILSTTLSLANDALPDKANASKDLAIWNLARNAPVVFATPVGGLLVSLGDFVSDALQLPIRGLGYRFLFVICAGLELVAAVIFCFVKPKV